ncbi:Chloride Channel (ClC) Family [Planoprotostelium fungivorum]|uniref:Chloride Channel (ClC) Family n=1 Tax=Planoprotostelium fungivorum TaxID=1890364 RepID=A0A2P6NB55_9EUKA|nr:Chloride Channel (ClC) Family [Planoprotostelium fungivorum]
MTKDRGGSLNLVVYSPGVEDEGNQVEMTEQNAQPRVSDGDHQEGGLTHRLTMEDYEDDEDHIFDSPEIFSEDDDDNVPQHHASAYDFEHRGKEVGRYHMPEGGFSNLAPEPEDEIIGGKWKRDNKDTIRNRKLRPTSVASSASLADEVKKGQPTQWTTNIPKSRWMAVLVLSVGLTGGAISAGIDIAVTNLGTARSKLTALSSNDAGGFFIWGGFINVLSFIAVALTLLIAPAAAGSGIPGLKCVVNGVRLENFLSWRALFVKMFGLVFSLGSGLIVGKEGPFVHLCVILGNCFLQTRVFRPVRQSEFLINIALAAACASGVAAHFGAIAGGVLFSIEITTSYYPTRNYFYGFLGAISGAIVWRYLRNLYYYGTPGFAGLILTAYNSTNIRFGMIELFIFILLGIICGILGVTFITINYYGFQFLRWVRLKNRILGNPVFVCGVIAWATALATYPRFLGTWASLAPGNAASDLFNATPEWTSPGAPVKINAGDWLNRNIFLNLALYALTRLILIPLSILLTLPAGLFVPSLTLGGAVGRIVGEAAYRWANVSPALFEGYSIITPGIYAMAGAAATVGSITHTLSAAVIVFEITDNLTPIVPVMVTTIVAVGVSRLLSLFGTYEYSAKNKGLPFLPDLHRGAYRMKARDIMDTNVHCISRELREEDVTKLMELKDEEEFPVVNDYDAMLLVGTISATDLVDLHGRVKVKEGEKEKKEEEQPMRVKAKMRLKEIGHDSKKVERKNKMKGHKQAIEIRSTPVRFVENHPVSQVHMLFCVMRITHGYVTRNGKLIGVITRKKLRDAIYQADKKGTLIH